MRASSWGTPPNLRPSELSVYPAACTGSLEGCPGLPCYTAKCWNGLRSTYFRSCIKLQHVCAIESGRKPSQIRARLHKINRREMLCFQTAFRSQTEADFPLGSSRHIYTFSCHCHAWGKASAFQRQSDAPHLYKLDIHRADINSAICSLQPLVIMPARPRPVSVAVYHSSDLASLSKSSRRVSYQTALTSTSELDTNIHARTFSSALQSASQHAKEPNHGPLTREAASDADVLLQADDGTLFPAHQWLLARASSVLAKSLSRLTRHPTAIASPQLTGPPVLVTGESSPALHLLLATIYPVSFLSQATSLPLTRKDTYLLGRLARTYSADHLTEAARRALLTYMTEDPTWSFAASWVFELPDVARAAAVESLRHTFLPLPDMDILRKVPAATLAALHDFRRRCARTAAHALARVAELECDAQVGRCHRLVAGRSHFSLRRQAPAEGRACLLAYIDAVALRLADYPHPSTAAESHDLLLKTCLEPETAPCASCRPRAQALLETKMDELRKRLEVELATVPLQLPF